MQFLSVSGWLRGLAAWLCSFIYQLVAWLYELFVNVSRVEILKPDSDAVKSIYQRITMILTIVMIFYVTFEVVKYVIQPDSFSDKEKGGGKLTLKMILVVILIAFVPSIFTWAYKFQNVIFDNQVFSKVILGVQGVDTHKFGRVFSANILGMFYYVDDTTWSQKELEEEDNCEGIPCKTVVNANLSSLIEYGELSFLELGITDGDEAPDEGTGDVFKYYIHFDGLFAVIVGIFVAYMLMIYCVDVGVRVVQLLFLQIIAPIPIIGYLSPKKDGIFQKWVQQCITTYLDLFIRTGIIYFGLLICQVLSDAYVSGDLFDGIPGDTSTTMKVFIYIALILGVLLFIQKAPKLLGELFPQKGAASGNFGLKAGQRVAPMAARAAGAAIGSTRMVTGALARARAAHARRKANDLDTREKRKNHRQQTTKDRDELQKKREAEQRTKKYGEAYNKARTEHDDKKAKLDATGKEYKAARDARIKAEREGKSAAEIAGLKQKETAARQKAEAAAKEYKPALDNLTRQRTNLLGEEEIAKEKAERAKAAIAAGEEREKLKQHQANLDSATTDAEMKKANAETIFSELNSSQEVTKQAEQAVNDAQTRQKQAQDIITQATSERGTIREEIAKEEAQLNAAKAAGLTDQNEIAKMEGKIAGLRYQESKVQEKIDSASAANSQAMDDEMEALSDLKSKQQKNSDIQQKYEEAQNISKSAETAKKTALEERNKSQESLTKQMNATQKQQYSTEEIENKKTTAETDRIVAESKLLEDINKERGTSYAGAIAGGIFSGGYEGITHGAQATKLNEIFKKVGEGYKSDNKKIDATQKYYEDGGTKTFVGRTIDQISKTVIGGPTEYHRTQITDIKPLETKIKNQESYAAIEADVKSKVDSTKDRAESKLEKEELKISADGFTKPKNISENVNVDTSQASTLSDVYRLYRANAEQKQSEANAAAQELQKQESITISGETTQQRDMRIQNAKVKAQQTAQIAQEARFAKEQIKKKAAEYAFTKILKDGIANARANSSYDQVMVDKVDDMLQSVRNARNNPETIESFKKYYDENTAEYNAFISGNFDNYDLLDNVQIALTNISTERTRNISGLKEQKRQIEVSNKTAAERADSEFNGGK